MNFNINSIANLARLKMTEKESSGFQKDFNNILALFGTIQTIETQDIEPMAHPMDLAQRLRPDIVTETDQHELFQSVAPAVENNLYLVPKVIGSE